MNIRLAIYRTLISVAERIYKDPRSRYGCVVTLAELHSLLPISIQVRESLGVITLYQKRDGLFPKSLTIKQWEEAYNLYTNSPH